MVADSPQRALLEANEAFYHAIEKRAMDAMERIWLHEGWVRCVHPGYDAVVGWPAVRKSFETMFANTSLVHVTPTAVDVMVFGEIGVIACVENITLESEDEMGMTAVQATNIFRLADGSGWRLMHHHASTAPMHVTQAFDGGVQ